MMKHISVITLMLSVFVLTACQEKSQKESAMNENPFFQKSELPFGAPDFTKIRNKDFQPAIEAGIEKKKEEIAAITNSAEAPTFENTFIPLEQSGQDLSRVLRVFSLLTSANTNDTLKKVREEMAPKLS